MTRARSLLWQQITSSSCVYLQETCNELHTTRSSLQPVLTLEMAVSYAPTKLRVPPGFQNLLEGLAREVLREQPEDILSFAAQYFKTQLAIREGKIRRQPLDKY